MPSSIVKCIIRAIAIRRIEMANDCSISEIASRVGDLGTLMLTLMWASLGFYNANLGLSSMPRRNIACLLPFIFI